MLKSFIAVSMLIGSIFIFIAGLNMYPADEGTPTIVTCDIFRGKCPGAGGCQYNQTFGTANCVITCITVDNNTQYTSKAYCTEPDFPDIIIFLPFFPYIIYIS